MFFTSFFFYCSIPQLLFVFSWAWSHCPQRLSPLPPFVRCLKLSTNVSWSTSSSCENANKGYSMFCSLHKIESTLADELKFAQNFSAAFLYLQHPRPSSLWQSCFCCSKDKSKSNVDTCFWISLNLSSIVFVEKLFVKF